MPALLHRLQQDHRQLHVLLNLLERSLDRFHQGIEPNYEVLAEALEYLESYADQVHHPSEEVLFRYLRDRLQGEVPQLEVLMRQHEVLSELTGNFRQILEGIIHEEVLRRDVVEAQGRELVEVLRKHLQQEETTLFPLAQIQLSEGDWQELEAQLAQKIGPLVDAQDLARFQTLYQRLLVQLQP